MSTIDVIILITYLLGMVGIGVWFARKASGSLTAYFLGNNQSKWWMLAASGAASNYDVAGTMYIISLFYVVGLRAFWMLWSWQFFSAAFLMSYMAVWVRRTQVMTAVELMLIRFGRDGGGKMARTAGAILMTTFLMTSIGYAFTGIQKFFPIILPDLQIGVSPETSGKYWAMIIMSLTTLYVVVGGFSGVVVTDFVSTVLMSLAGILVGAIVWYKLDPAMVETLHANFSTELLPKATLENMPEGYESWRNLWQFSIYWALAGLLIHMNGAGGHYQEQRFLATRNNADAGKTGCAWGFFLIPRWAMIAGFVCIAATGMVQSKDPEQILPIVLIKMIPTGVRGLLLAGLVAAFMSTFSSVVNAAASMVVRDLIQPACPKLKDHTLVRISYVVTIAVVVVGMFIGFHTDSINGIWQWMLAGLIGGMLIPNILRWHWWRLNGWGYSFGLFGGLLTALVVVLFPGKPEYMYGPIIWAVTLLGSILGSLLTKPTDPEVLKNFYTRVRPWGFWGPVKVAAGELPPLVAFDRSPLLIVFNVVMALICFFSSYLFVFFIVGHFVIETLITASLIVATGIILYFTWYRRLPKD